MTNVKETILQQNTQITELTNKLNENQQTITEMKNQYRILEDRNRRNNLRIDGIRETEKETWKECEEKVMALLENKLNIKDVIIERAHRMGKRQRNRPRTTIFKLLNYKDKERILEHTNINEDFSFETIEIRKRLKKKDQTENTQ